MQPASEFVKVIQNNLTVYTVIWAKSAESADNVICIQSASVISSLLKKYAAYKNMFNTEKTEILSAYKLSDYVIDLNEKESFYSLLYNSSILNWEFCVSILMMS